MQKSFVQLKRAWYGKANLDLKDCLDEICINVKAKNSECKEFCIRWYDIGKKEFPSGSVEIFEDMWGVFELIPELFIELGKLEKTNAQPEDVCELLEEMGFKDKTPVSRSTDKYL